MNEIFEYLKKNYLFIINVILLLIIIIILLFKIFADKKEETVESNYNNNYVAYESDIKETDKILVNVDLKGAVKKPGIYQVEDKSTINDVIRKSGGLLKNATTIDVNLSKQVYNEMVIYISTKNEYKKRNSSNICDSDNKSNDDKSYEIASNDTFVSDYNNSTANKTIISNSNNNNDIKKENNMSSDETSTIININNATIDDLQNIPGIGKSKAEKIISYRNENGPFKSIEDIKNVSGIGDSMYEKIREYITI